MSVHVEKDVFFIDTFIHRNLYFISCQYLWWAPYLRSFLSADRGVNWSLIRGWAVIEHSYPADRDFFSVNIDTMANKGEQTKMLWLQTAERQIQA